MDVIYMDSRVLIDLDRIGYNVKEVLRQYPTYQYYIGVVKADAYGHGMAVVHEMVENGINYLAVSTIEEALEIRKYDREIPILCLVPILLRDVKIAVQQRITLTIHDWKYFEELCKVSFSGTLKIHIKLDTGMNRLGFKDAIEVKKVVDEIKKRKEFFLEGIYTHFATIGMYDPHWDQQVKRFLELTNDISLREIPIVHVGSSVILQTHPKLDFCNGFRVGVMLYGYSVAPVLSSSWKDRLRMIKLHYSRKKYQLSSFSYNPSIDLKPAMKMESYLVQIKKVSKGEFVGYGAQYVAPEDLVIGILPIGYMNGLFKSIVGGYVFIKKNFYSVLSITMNMMIVKLDESVSLEDPVVLLGSPITVGKLAGWMGCSFVEVLLNLGKNNKRVYTKDNQVIELEKRD